MAGAAGIEPANTDTKNQCLTAWRRPTNCDAVSIEWDGMCKDLLLPFFHIKKILSFFAEKYPNFLGIFNRHAYDKKT